MRPNPYEISFQEAKRLTRLPGFVLKEMSEISRHQGALISVRPSESARPFNRDLLAYKDFGIKVKTSTVQAGGPLLMGFIAEDQAIFGRLEGEQSVYTTDTHARFAQLYGALDDLLNGLKTGEYIHLKREGSAILFELSQSYERQIIFKIDLKNSHASGLSQKLFPTEGLQIPAWWTAEDGDFYQALEERFAVYYAVLPDGQMKPLNILVEDEGIPVTSDLDLFMIAAPKALQCTSLHRVHDTRHISGFIELICDMLRLQPKLVKNNAFSMLDIFHHMKTHMSVGFVTAYEMLIMLQINARCSERGHRWLPILQHGPENRHYSAEHVAVRAVLHYWHGRFYLTRNEAELCDFLKIHDINESCDISRHDSWRNLAWGSTAFNVVSNIPRSFPTLANADGVG